MPIAPAAPQITYSYVTLAGARSQLAARLYDTGQTFWSPAELNAYLTEALRTWNSIANFFRADFTFDATALTSWFSLPTQPNTLRPFTVSDATLYALLEYSLLEPQDSSGTWQGTSQFSMSDLVAAVSRRRDEVLSTTACTVAPVAVPAPLSTRRVLLPDTVLALWRAAYIDVNGAATPLTIDDSFAFDSYQTGWTNSSSGTPSAVSLATQPAQAFSVDRVPTLPGQYNLVAVLAGPTLAAGSPVPLGIPDDFFWVVKFGALADLLSRDSDAADPLRAAYCLHRYREGLSLLAQAPAVLSARVNNIPVDIAPITEADTFSTGWQSASPSTPATVLVAGLNLLALAPQQSTPVPPNSVASVTVTVVENAPIPTSDLDYLQLARDEYDAVLGYAQHLAMFKLGGAEFLGSMPLLDAFFRAASMYNSKLAHLSPYKSVIFGQSQSEESAAPRFDPALLGGNQ